ncbi:MAG: hypothetical protein KDA25_02210, partial [Phycisphaerales bacterium]|nr:hypothetical protein [Phycisphaerales bacterium]
MSAPSDTPLIARHDGVGLFSAAETILKGLVESEAEVDLLSGARWGVFGRVFDLLADETVAEVCRLHGLRVVATPDERRSLMLAAQAAQAGRSAIALVPNARLGQTSALLERLLARPRPGSLAILFEDAPGDVPTMCPRHVSRALDLPTLEAGDLAELRSAVGLLPRLTRASGRPVALIVHRSILHQHDTMEVVPNRVLRPLEAVLVGRRRRPRRVSVETGNTLRLVRRLELNTIRCLPSPGERVPVGFVVVGAAAPAMRHLTTVLQLTERVPIVRLTVVNPIDDAIVERLLARCVNVIVLEARPGVVEADILEIAEAMRRGDHRPAAIWGRQLPPTTPDGVPGRLRPDDAVHPSILARRIVHLLHLIRPTMQIASRLVPERRSDEVDVAERRDDFGAAAARQVVRAIVDETDVWLRERAPFAELDVAPTALALDGVAAPGAPARIVNTEIWDRAEFLDGGLSALRQVARSDQPWLIIVCDVSSDDDREDLERLMRGAVPGERADRVRIEVVDLTDRATVRQTIRDIVVRDGSTMLIVRDGEPPRYDTVAVARAAAETDRLGYDPIQRLIRRTDAVCELEAPPLPNLGAARPESELRSGFRADAMRSGRRRQVQIRVRPLYEQIEVVRTKAPASGDAVGVGLPVPRPIASQQTHWRAHLAGYRGDAPGFVASILADAGGTMGYHVRVTFDARPIGHGRRAWAQVTFSRPVSGPGEVRLTGRVPYGEADLLLGVDPAEAMRAVGPDRQLRVASADHTACVINTGLHGDEMDLGVVAPSAEAIETAFATVSREALGLAVDVAAACRA